MQTRSKAAAAIILTAIAAGGATVAAHAGDGDAEPTFSVLSEGGRAPLDDTTRRLLGSSSVEEVTPDPAGARALGTFDGETWAVVPGARGACLAGPGGELACAGTETVDDGRLMAITGADPFPDHVDPAKLRSGGIDTAPVPLSRAKVIGLVPDGVRRVQVLAGSGAVLARADVTDNAYVVRDVDLDEAAALRLVADDGRTRSRALK